MGKGPCFKCGGAHFAADCPEIKFAAELGTAADGRPPWCGECDKRTRLIGDIDRPHRCPACHPDKDLPVQYRICKCGNAVYRWDRMPCGTHREVGKQLRYAERKAK